MRALLVVTLFLIFPTLTNAQSFGGNFFGTEPTLTVEPSTPAPQQPFTATIADYTGSEITWTYNGSPIPEATNLRTVSLVAGDLGSRNVLVATLKGVNGAQTVSTTITPIYLDLIVEPQTHVPFFYTGRPLASAGSDVIATALINAKLVGDYIYTWRVNNQVVGGGPTRGLAKASFTMPQDSTVTLSLTVTDINGQLVGRRAVNVPSVRPKLLFYEVNTLYGMSDRSIENTFALIGNSATVQAEPYYLSSAVFNTPSQIEWEINDTAVATPVGNPYAITLERSAESGRATISFRVLSTAELLQHAVGSFEISL